MSPPPRAEKEEEERGIYGDRGIEYTRLFVDISRSDRLEEDDDMCVCVFWIARYTDGGRR